MRCCASRKPLQRRPTVSGCVGRWKSLSRSRLGRTPNKRASRACEGNRGKRRARTGRSVVRRGDGAGHHGSRPFRSWEGGHGPHRGAASCEDSGRAREPPSHHEGVGDGIRGELKGTSCRVPATPRLRPLRSHLFPSCGFARTPRNQSAINRSNLLAGQATASGGDWLLVLVDAALPWIRGAPQRPAPPRAHRSSPIAPRDANVGLAPHAQADPQGAEPP